MLRGGAGRHEGVSLPATVFPLAASLDGVLSLAGPPSFEGAGEVSSSLFGRLRNRGRTFIEEDRVLAGWTWSWSDAPAQPELRRTAAELGWGGLPEELDVGGRPGARGSLKGAITDPRVGAELSVEELELSFAPGAANEPDSTW